MDARTENVLAFDPLEIPIQPDDLACHYDLTVAHPDDPRRFAAFDNWLAEASDSYGLACARLTTPIVAEAAARLATGDLSIGLHLGCETPWSTEGDFARLALAAQDAGGHPVNAPSRARTFTDRATVQHELQRRALGVPPTIILRPWADVRSLTDRHGWYLRLDEPGTRVEIIPSGQGDRIRVDRPTLDQIATTLNQARTDYPNETLLLRPEIRPPWLMCGDGQCRPAHWRIVSCLGEVTVFWWQPTENLCPGQLAYREVTPDEIHGHALAPLFHYTHALADLCGLEWFSAELTLCPFADTGAFTIPNVDGLDLPLVMVGSLRDGCDLEVQSRSRAGLPDEFVRRVAWRLTELAWQVRRGSSLPEGVLQLRAG